MMVELSETHLIESANRVEGQIRVPGDKSISHRALIVSAMGEGDCRILGALASEDVLATREALALLGVAIENSDPSVEPLMNHTSQTDWDILVRGEGFRAMRAPESVIDCRNSGTTMRILVGVLAASEFTTELDGDGSLRSRPMKRVASPLRRMGAKIATTQGHAPVRIEGSKLTGVDCELEIASAQVKTAILLAGLSAEGRTSVGEPTRSRDHTERLLKFLGVQIETDANRTIVKSTKVQNASELYIPGDVSAAAFLLVAAAILPGSDLTIEGVGLNPTRTSFLDLLRDFGAEVTSDGIQERCGEPFGTIRIRAGDRRPLEVDASEIPGAIDEIPLVAVLGAMADGSTTVRGAAELRIKESDRISAICSGLSAMGADIQSLPDGFVVKGGRRLTGASVDSLGDHRIGMALAVAALAADGPSTISRWNAVAVSYPQFAEALAGIVVARA